MGLQPLNNVIASQEQGAINNRRTLFNGINSDLGYFTGSSGDPSQSPLYKSFLSGTKESISNTYDNAIQNARGNANSRGFGYASPNEQTSELGVRAQEAGALSQAPSTALQETVPYTLAATGQELQEGQQLTSSANADLAQQTKVGLQQNANKLGMLNSLSTLAGTILGGPLGGDLGNMLFKQNGEEDPSIDSGNSGDWGGETGG